jgi:hypothetical protein
MRIIARRLRLVRRYLCDDGRASSDLRGPSRAPGPHPRLAFSRDRGRPGTFAKGWQICMPQTARDLLASDRHAEGLEDRACEISSLADSEHLVSKVENESSRQRDEHSK